MKTNTTYDINSFDDADFEYIVENEKRFIESQKCYQGDNDVDVSDVDLLDTDLNFSNIVQL